MDELLQAGQALDPLREMQFDMAGNIGGLAFINGPPFGLYRRGMCQVAIKNVFQA